MKRKHQEVKGNEQDDGDGASDTDEEDFKDDGEIEPSSRKRRRAITTKRSTPIKRMSATTRAKRAVQWPANDARLDKCVTAFRELRPDWIMAMVILRPLGSDNLVHYHFDLDTATSCGAPTCNQPSCVDPLVGCQAAHEQAIHVCLALREPLSPPSAGPRFRRYTVNRKLGEVSIHSESMLTTPLHGPGEIDTENVMSLGPSRRLILVQGQVHAYEMHAKPTGTFRFCYKEYVPATASASRWRVQHSISHSPLAVPTFVAAARWYHGTDAQQSNSSSTSSSSSARAEERETGDALLFADVKMTIYVRQLIEQLLTGHATFCIPQLALRKLLLHYLLPDTCWPLLTDDWKKVYLTSSCECATG